MTWDAELTKMRRFLRDPDGDIWSDDYIRHLWNDIQNDWQHRTGVLEDVYTQRVPGVYVFSYQREWEYQHIPTTETQYYRCLNEFDDYVFCHRWEPQTISGISADVGDYGAHFTQPWEAFMDTPGEVVKIRFPRNFNFAKFFAYDEEPIDEVTKKDVQSYDPSYVSNSGMPICYYRYDDTDNSFVLYPRPSTGFVNELSGEGMALFADDDTEDTTFGAISVRTGSVDSSSNGISADVVDVESSVFMVYSISPLEIEAGIDVPDVPDFLRKYIDAGTISRAYGGNTDGRIRSLADYWRMRYDLGIQFTKKYMSNKRQDRDYRLTGQVDVRRRRRGPRLPDTYPAVYP